MSNNLLLFLIFLRRNLKLIIMKPFYCKFLKENCVKGVKEHNHCMEYCWNCIHYGKVLNPTQEEINDQNKPF